MPVFRIQSDQAEISVWEPFKERYSLSFKFYFLWIIQIPCMIDGHKIRRNIGHILIIMGIICPAFNLDIGKCAFISLRSR